MALTDARAGDHRMASLNSHELAHQWFGDYVTCKEWGDVWLNESFATFMEAFYLEHSRGAEAYQRDMENNLQSYLNEARRYKRPLSTKLYSSPEAMFDRHTYPKGGFILHMLRLQLGDADFFKGLGYYLRTNAYAPVDAHDLSKAFEVSTGKNVDEFFDQWIYKPGHPELETAWKYDDAAKVVILTVKQTQDTTQGTPIYHFPLRIDLLPSGSAASVQQTVFQVTKASEEFRLSAASRPAAVLLDPEHELLKDWKTAPTENENLAILKFAPSPVDRSRALSALTSGNEAAPEALRPVLAALIPGETSADVARVALELLGNTKNPAYRALYREQAKSKQYRREAAALRGLGLLPTLEQADIALLRTVALSDKEKYEPVQEAMQALAKSNAKDNLDVFRHQMASHTVRDTLAYAAVSALADSNSPDAAPLLLDAAGNAGFRAPLRARAIAYFKDNLKTDSKISDALLPLLNASGAEAQIAAIEALTARNDKAAVPALQSLAASARNARVVTAAKDAVTKLSGS
jgi:aminopeptidase N